MRHGHGTHTNLNNGLIYTGEWKNNIRHGYGTEEHYNGTSWAGEWNYYRHGFGTFTDNNGVEHAGEWKNNELINEHVNFTDSNGKYDKKGDPK